METRDWVSKEGKRSSRWGAVKEVMEEKVDPELIGGMVIRVGDRVFDSSVANQLNKMARRTRSGFSGQILQRFKQFTSE